MYQITTVRQDLDRRNRLKERAARLAAFKRVYPYVLVFVLLACVAAAGYGDHLAAAYGI